NIVVDPDAIQTNPHSWKPVIKVPDDQDSGRTHSSIIGDGSKPRSKTSGVLGTSFMQLFVGKRGRIPAGPVPVNLIYRDKANVELLAEANFTLEVAPAGWEMDPANRKVNLYTQDGKTELDQPIVKTSQRASRIDWTIQDDEYERKQFAFQLLAICDDSLIGKPLQLHVYALNARYSDEIPDGRKDMLVVSGSQRDRMKRCQLPQGTFIEIFSDQIWVVEKNAKNNKWVSFVTEREGMCPDGVHELGIICEREGEILYQSKIKVRVEDQWGLPESETKLIVRDPNRVELEKNPIITAHRLPKNLGKWDGQTSTGVRTRHSEEGLSFPLVFECKGEELEGPWCMNYYFKKPQKSGDIAIGWKALTTPTKEGYIYNSSNHFPITQTSTFSPGQVQEISTLMLWVGNDQPEHDGQGSIPPGIHDIGIEICNFKNSNWVPIYRGSVRLKVSD
ncbi:MAG: hypothetical protein OJI67_13740, partial [Prosthecobacter sp.]|nr:hypothetical protein [Prosthecobacter sp.]